MNTVTYELSIQTPECLCGHQINPGDDFEPIYRGNGVTEAWCVECPRCGRTVGKHHEKSVVNDFSFLGLCYVCDQPLEDKCECEKALEYATRATRPLFDEGEENERSR